MSDLRLFHGLTSLTNYVCHVNNSNKSIQLNYIHNSIKKETIITGKITAKKKYIYITKRKEKNCRTRKIKTVRMKTVRYMFCKEIRKKAAAAAEAEANAAAATTASSSLLEKCSIYGICCTAHT